ncbi:hypothetical protein Tco_1084009 [Tanacetum coccineum]
MELKPSSRFKIFGLLQPCQTLCKIFSKCLTTRVTGWDQPSLQLMQNVVYSWMITEEMKQTEHYRMYVEVFGLDVPLTQRSTRLTPPSQDTLQDTLQVSLAEYKSHEEQEVRENVALVNKHLATAEIDKLVDDLKNVVDDSSPPRNDDTTILGTRLEPRSDKESSEVEITKEKEVEITKETEVEFVAKTMELTSDKASPEVDITKENEEDITNIVPPMNVDDEEDEIIDEVYELKRREKGKDVEESRNSPIPTSTRSSRNFSNLVSSDTEKL